MMRVVQIYRKVGMIIFVLTLFQLYLLSAITARKGLITACQNQGPVCQTFCPEYRCVRRVIQLFNLYVVLEL